MSATTIAPNPSTTQNDVVQNTVAQNNADEFKQAFDRELASDKYSEITTTKHWERIENAKMPDTNPELGWLGDILRVISDVMEGFVPLMSMLVKGILVLGLLWFFYWLYQRRTTIGDWFGETARQKNAKSGFDKRHKNRQDPLADDDELARQIKNAIANENYVLALSLLYRSSLRAMQLDHELPIKKSDTEAMCQRLLANAKQTHAGELPYFDRLVALWQMSAYGDKLPDNVQTVLTGLFADWQRIYRTSANGGV